MYVKLMGLSFQFVNTEEKFHSNQMGRTSSPSMVPERTYLNPKQDDQMEVIGYKFCKWRYIMSWVLYLMTFGLLRMLFYWLPHLMVKFTHNTCSLDRAEKVIMKDQYNRYFVSTVSMDVLIKDKGRSSSSGQLTNCSMDDIDSNMANRESRWFITKKIKYIWDPKVHNFVKLRGLESGTKFSDFHRLRGYSVAQQAQQRQLYGVNSFAVHVTPIHALLFKEISSPVYIFQVFSMAVWYVDDYNIYATCMAVISTISIVITIWEARKFQRALRNTIATSTIVSVCRDNNEYEDISSEDLVPGDIIEIPRKGCHMHCDAVLISGNCTVNESMLTGESVPIHKTSIPNPLVSVGGEDKTSFCMKNHSRHVLFAGTQIMQTGFYGNEKVRAVVLRTGFLTSKGDLVRSILYPKPEDFKFRRHAYYFTFFLACIAFMGIIYTVYLMVEKFHDTAEDTIIRSLDLITITVPPALPAALTMGNVFAQRRLRTRDIYCLSSRSIKICGAVNTVCFDKTGTLTEDGLNIHSVVPAVGQKFQTEIRDTSQLTKGPLLEAMATCHSLTIIEGELMGDPLDLKMFNATDWELEEPGEEESRFDMIVPTIVRPRHQISQDHNSNEVLRGDDIGIVRQFPFSSSLQRMSVITRRLGANHFDLYVKGSPEMITSLSLKESVPIDFHEILTSYTLHGYRVIALAKKQLPDKLNSLNIKRFQREQMECDLTFLGLLVMENRLKPATTPVIQQLLKARLRTIMVTGDNMLTALSVARECGMVGSGDLIIQVQAYPPEYGRSKPEIEFYYTHDPTKRVEEIKKTKGSEVIDIDKKGDRFHFAVMGKSWAVIRQYNPDLLTKLAVRGTVFARMSPNQKAQLVEALQEAGYYVAMCGDGANDCGALKAANAGISLSESEASVASPFTSKTPTIECVPAIIREGRGSLVTAFGIFKFMACYSLTQFTSVLILYWSGANLTDAEFLYQDLFITTTLFVTFSRTLPYDQLSKERPPIDLISPVPILSIATQMIIMIIIQLISVLCVRHQPWFVPYKDNPADYYTSHENAAVFLTSASQHIILAVTFSKGAPFRKTMFTNWLFIVNLVVCTVVTIWIIMYPTEPIAKLLVLDQFPSMKFKAFFLGLAFINALVSIVVEMFILDNVQLHANCGLLVGRHCTSGKQRYVTIESELQNDPKWPPVCNQSIDLAAIFQRHEDFHQGHSEQVNFENLLEGSEQELYSKVGMMNCKPHGSEHVSYPSEALTLFTSGTAACMSMHM